MAKKKNISEKISSSASLLNSKIDLKAIKQIERERLRDIDIGKLPHRFFFKTMHSKNTDAGRYRYFL